jgi:hypothetical protein
MAMSGTYGPAREEESIATIHAALVPAGRRPRDALRQKTIRVGGPRRGDQIVGALGAHSIVPLPECGDLICHIRQIRELVHDHLRLECSNGVGQRTCVVDIAHHRLRPKPCSTSSLAGERVIPATWCPPATGRGSSRMPIAPVAPARKMRIQKVG